MKMERKNIGLYILSFIILVAIVAGNLLLKQPDDQGLVEEVIDSQCYLTKQNCSVEFNNNIVTFALTGEPRPLLKIPLSLDKASLQLKSVVISLTMPGMDMGKNIFKMKPASDTTWNTDIVIPVCTTGRRDWKLEALVNPESAKSYRVVFWLNL